MRCKGIATLETVCSMSEYNLEDSSSTKYLLNTRSVSIMVLNVADMAVSKADTNPHPRAAHILMGRD